MTCSACGSKEEAYFSRSEPMGYFCPDCGHPEGQPYVPEKPNAGIVGMWVSVEDEMPDDELTVIVWFDGDAALAFHDSELLEKRKGDTGWIMAGSSRVLRNVTHWCREVLPPNDRPHP